MGLAGEVRAGRVDDYLTHIIEQYAADGVSAAVTKTVADLALEPRGLTYGLEKPVRKP